VVVLRVTDSHHDAPACGHHQRSASCMVVSSPSWSFWNRVFFVPTFRACLSALTLPTSVVCFEMVEIVLQIGAESFTILAETSSVSPRSRVAVSAVVLWGVCCRQMQIAMPHATTMAVRAAARVR